MQVAAIGIALGYGLLTFVLLGRRRLRQSWLLAAAAGGALAFPVALALVNPIQVLLASLFRWDMDAYSTTLGIGLLGIVVAAIVNEILTLAPALLAWSLGGERGDALVFGAAAGAGFGVVGAHQVIVYALIARTLPIGSAVGFASALVQQFAFVTVHTAATALAAYGASRHRIGAFLAAAIGAESVLSALALLFSVRVYSGPVWTLAIAAAGIGGLLLACTFVLSRGGGPRPRL
jgi:hypothetical protein